MKTYTYTFGRTSIPGDCEKFPIGWSAPSYMAFALSVLEDFGGSEGLKDYHDDVVIVIQSDLFA